MRGRGPAAGIAVAVLVGAFLTQLPVSPLRFDFVGNGRVGALEGAVVLSGDVEPSPTAVSNTTDPEVCGRTQSLEDLLVGSDSRGVENAIVALVDVPASALASVPAPRRVVIDNRGCRFEPHVAVAAVGDTIVATNSDPVFHTTHYYGPLSSNVALAQPGESVASVARQVGIISVLCDLHGWMRGFVRVDEHRFHDVSDPRGSFRMAGIPPGTYTVEIWHERLGTQQRSILVEPGKTTRIEVAYSLQR